MNSTASPLFDVVRSQIRHVPPVQRVGTVLGVSGLVIESDGPNVGLGNICNIRSPRSGFAVRAEVVGFREHRILLMPLGDTAGLHVGCEVVAADRPPLPSAGPQLLGRVLDASASPMMASACCRWGVTRARVSHLIP
jgi:flagellum-specific ATP synthase